MSSYTRYIQIMLMMFSVRGTKRSLNRGWKKSKSKKQKVQDSHDPDGTCILRLFIGYFRVTVLLKSKLPPLIFFLGRKESRLAREEVISRDKCRVSSEAYILE